MLRFMLCAFFLLHPAVRPHEAGKPANADLLDAAAVQAGDLNLKRTKSRTLFARRGVQEKHSIQTLKPKLAPPPALERCSHVTESCGPHLNCCHPCATCRCHFFNSICYCWRLSQHCIKKG
ncbi:agouti-signaling protein 2b isoform X2 [Brienomyrus brachyistius]|nr:agouti-signaling protein 2b isoform X2 [Brienomyrus brachyistius]XP_048868516.1 agouti-signaling protein 2b isoform X2 [Brienomyrus brachyistius]